MSLGEETAAEARPDGKAGTSSKGTAGAAGESSARPRGPASSLGPAVTRARELALVATGLATYRARMLPSFLIVGGARCGSTSMFIALSWHPAVFGAGLQKKHLNYFDDKYRRGMPWYRSHFPLKAQARMATRSAGLTPVAFEATPDYMYHPLAPERIARDLPGVKLLALVRDPVERAGSQHAYQVIDGYEKEPFEKALELEDARLDGEVERMVADPSYYSYNYQHFGYRARGHYADQLERLEKLVGRDRIHVIDSDDFFADPAPVYDQVIEFLGLPHRGHPPFGRHNARPRTPMPETVRTSLEEHFRPHDERLAAWLGHEPSWRR
jgi:Sulfotransferase domain